MKVTVERASLLKSLGHVHRVVERRNTIPILANVLVRAEGSKLSFKATDLDLEITETIAAEVSPGGSTTVPAHMFYEIVRKLPEGTQVVIEGSGDRAVLALRAGRSRFTLQTLPESDFPDLAAGEMTHSFKLGAADLKRLIDKTQFAISTEETRYYLNGIYLHAAGTGKAQVLRAVATDGHRLALVVAPRDRTTAENGAGASSKRDRETAAPGGSQAAEEVRAILPKKTLGELGRLLAEGDGDIRYERGENHLFFDVGGRTLISRMIDGQFPAYERVIPKGNDKHIEFERDRLTNAVKRVALLSNERSRAVKFQIDNGRVDVTSSSPELGEAHETLSVDYSGGAMQICFNAQYVLDFLAAVATDVVSLELKDEVSQAVMKPVGAEGYDYTYVIMPMRV